MANEANSTAGAFGDSDEPLDPLELLAPKLTTHDHAPADQRDRSQGAFEVAWRLGH